MEGGEDGGDDSEFGSMTSSQVSLLMRSRFVGLSPDRRNLPEISSGDGTEADSNNGSDHTEVLVERFSSPLVRTPILTSPDSVFRTPPEEPYLSSAADSYRTVRVSVTDPASASVTATGGSESPSAGTEKVRVSETEPASATGNLESPPSGAKVVRNLEAAPASATVNVRVLETEPDSAFVANTGDSESPSSGAKNAKVSGKAPASAPLSFSAGNVGVSRKRSGSASAAPTRKFRVLEAAGVATNDSAEALLPLSLKDVIQAILCNSGEAGESAEYEKLSIVDILRKSGIRFPH